MDTKSVVFQGTNNKYQMKKITQSKKEKSERKIVTSCKKWNKYITADTYSTNLQYLLLSLTNKVDIRIKDEKSLKLFTEGKCFLDVVSQREPSITPPEYPKDDEGLSLSPSGMLVECENKEHIIKIMKQEIGHKLNSYKHQDITKNIYNEPNFITLDYILNMLCECKLKCIYCKEDMLILYNIARENMQWSVDRINNDIGHDMGNVVISCLLCNLRRRRQNKDDFLFTKQLKIKRISYST